MEVPVSVLAPAPEPARAEAIPVPGADTSGLILPHEPWAPRADAGLG